MSKFDFLKINTRHIDYDKFDNRLLNYVLENEPSFHNCISCGCCTASCSAGKLTSFNIRRIGLSLRRGEIGKLNEEISKCMMCGKCSLVCPRDIQLRNVVFLIKKGIVELKKDNIQIFESKN